jgi:hypothetical protein
MEVSILIHAQCEPPLEKRHRYELDKRLFGPENGLDALENSVKEMKTKSSTFQPAACQHTN